MLVWTPKLEKFSNLYVELGNSSEAYREAFNVSESTTTASIHTLAWRTLSRVDVRLRVTELQNELGEKYKIKQGYIVEQLLSIINDVNYTVDLAMLEKSDTDETKRFYKMKEITTNTDKLRAIDMLTKMLGLNAPERTQQDIKIEIVEKRRD